EIGPGPGALTRYLRESVCSRLTLLEKDDRFAALHSSCPRPGLQVIHGDALTYPWEKLAAPCRIVGNLPYNIASPLMWDIVSRTRGYVRAVFMIQKEVADRILAEPGSKTYGALSVWIQSYAVPRKGFIVRPGAFSPPPKVDSAVITLAPLPRTDFPRDAAALATLLKICFQQRRKQLQRILRSHFSEENILASLEESGIAPARRPETLTPEEFQKLALRLFYA
ncbi:MAG TPA: ribosomal RNA small subunit methyltransferase A, partial [Candidatus Mailhella excrementigallinarum]|nr:ribosomal RNA small subunit methyltransferase A [Candidatus Mailhella excrementigallinarum]